MSNSLINIQYCYNYLVNQIPINLLFYIHLTVVAVSLMFSVYLLYKKRTLPSIILFLVCSSFAVWALFDLGAWFAFLGSGITMFTWELTYLFTLLFFFFSYYFLYTFYTDCDLPFWQKLMSVIIIAPVSIWVFKGQGLIAFDGNTCESLENGLVSNYYFIAQGIFFIAVILLTNYQIKKVKDKIKKREFFLAGLGVIVFLAFFLFTDLATNLLADYDIVQYAYNFSIYGLLGMPLLLGSLVYIIVKFKTFDIKLLGAQALVWFLIIIIGAEFFFIQTNVNRILTSITLIVSVWTGLIIVRGVKREIALREDLQVANKGQENLIHIMNHQVKGFFGIAKNIFAELLQSDDYGHMPDASKPLLEKGFETTNAGVSYVQDILRGASAEKGILPYDMKLINIKDVISPLLIEQKDIAVKKGLSFESNIEEGDYNMIGDAVQLKEALKNLITNAIRYNDYTIAGGMIDVDLKRKGDKIIFLVKDTGVGIAEEDKPRLFTAGGRGKNSIKINVESSGYGLVFVKDVAEKHKGTVGYKPNKPGRGTTFFMELSAKMDGGMIISSAN